MNGDVQLNDDVLGNNTFAYCSNNPINRYDGDGQCWVTLGIMAIGGVIGGTISAISSAVSQKFFTGSVNLKSVGVAFASGFVSGAIAASPLGLPGQVIANATIGGVSYVADSYVNKQEVKLDELIVATGSGAVSGLIGGPGANKNMVLTDAIKGTKQVVTRELRRVNQKFAQKAITSAVNRRNNILSYGVSTASLKFVAGAAASNGLATVYDEIKLFFEGKN